MRGPGSGWWFVVLKAFFCPCCTKEQASKGGATVGHEIHRLCSFLDRSVSDANARDVCFLVLSDAYPPPRFGAGQPQQFLKILNVSAQALIFINQTVTYLHTCWCKEGDEHDGHGAKEAGPDDANHHCVLMFLVNFTSL